MPSGELDQRIDLRRHSLTDDGSGGAARTTATYATVWAKVKPMTGREREASRRDEAVANYLVRIRYRDDVLAGDIIRWRSRDMNVRFIRDAGPRPQYLDIEAELGVAI